MKSSEVIDLMMVIKRAYSNFDVSSENIQHHEKYLRDFPFDAAMANVDKHILTERFPPTIADIRGRLGDQQDAQRGREAAAAHFANLDDWGASASPPPAGFWERVRERLRGGADAGS